MAHRKVLTGSVAIPVRVTLEKEPPEVFVIECIFGNPGDPGHQTGDGWRDDRLFPVFESYSYTEFHRRWRWRGNLTLVCALHDFCKTRAAGNQDGESFPGPLAE
jgi:hypothetical protein